jgi:hypothetical protein
MPKTITNNVSLVRNQSNAVRFELMWVLISQIFITTLEATNALLTFSTGSFPSRLLHSNLRCSTSCSTAVYPDSTLFSTIVFFRQSQSGEAEVSARTSLVSSGKLPNRY